MNDGWPDLEIPDRPHPDDVFWKRKSKKQKLTLFFTLLALVALTYPADIASYCRGYCAARYQDGIERAGKCACIDYYPINLENRIPPLKQARRPIFGYIPEMRTAPEPSAPEPSWDEYR